MHKNNKELDLLDILINDSKNNDLDKVSNDFVEIIKSSIELYNKVMDLDVKKSSGKDLYDILTSVYDLELDASDLFTVLLKKNGVYYNRIALIPTTMVVDSNQVYLNAALSSNMVKARYKVYSLNEIKKLIDGKQIVIFFEEYIPIDNVSFNVEAYEKLPSININKKRLGYDIEGFIYDNIDLFGDIFKKNINKKMLLEDLKTLLVDLKSQVNDIYSLARSSSNEYNELASMCKKKLEGSKEKGKFNSIQKKLKRKRFL